MVDIDGKLEERILNCKFGFDGVLRYIGVKEVRDGIIYVDIYDKISGGDVIVSREVPVVSNSILMGNGLLNLPRMEEPYISQ